MSAGDHDASDTGVTPPRLGVVICFLAFRHLPYGLSYVVCFYFFILFLPFLRNKEE
ncbi:hypothetical protein BDW42DRAFT_173074 [Aspergillus taichungensis]|uniref:Uncharacterized protein n=1 Tax=Aspergillus taichungensis TaxID=482145 RepID=A0A2J5HPW8_9EURO|nr:hypothetical protein BDW42DRAFT_173074 [Aspergillus taichungensis]